MPVSCECWQLHQIPEGVPSGMLSTAIPDATVSAVALQQLLDESSASLIAGGESSTDVSTTNRPTAAT